MKKLLFLIIILVYNFCTAQSAPPKRPLPPPSNYQKESDSASAIALRFLQKEKIPGLAIAVSKNDGIIYSIGLGYGDLEKQSKVDPAKTQFRIASISKSLTALALAKLVEDRKLDFNTSIYTYLPNFPKKKYDFTVKQVAGHIAGIRHYRGKEFLLNKKMSITEGLNVFKNDPLLFRPGTEYKYSTYGWNLLSEVIQKTANQPFSIYMKNEVFEPLKMNNTVLEIVDSIVSYKTQFYKKTNAGDIIIGPEVNNEFKAAGGGFLSTANDLILFGNEIINPTLVDNKIVTELVTSQVLNDGKKTNYGIGFATNTTKKETHRYSHSGGGIGASSLLLMYPDEKVVIVILSNLSNAKIKELGNQLEQIFLK